MSFEIAAAALAQPAAAASGAAAQPMQVGYGVSLTDFNGFAQSMAQAGQRLEARPVSAPTEAAKQLMKPFEHINGEANQLAILAKDAQAAGQDMSPSQMVNLSVRCQEFMFHCQLTSNIANRASEGVQQLFRQQS
jgi:predicted transglutaminase-like cysteine proteinase